MSRYQIRDPRKLFAVPLILLLLLGGAQVVLADAPPNIDTFADNLASFQVYGAGSAVT